MSGCLGTGRLLAHEDPADPRNGAAHHTGKACVEDGCDEPAGTAWSPHWCFRHNVERIRRNYRGMRDALARLEGGR